MFYYIIIERQLFILESRSSYWWQRLDLCEHSSVVALRGGPNAHQICHLRDLQANGASGGSTLALLWVQTPLDLSGPADMADWKGCWLEPSCSKRSV